MDNELEICIYLGESGSTLIYLEGELVQGDERDPVKDIILEGKLCGKLVRRILHVPLPPKMREIGYVMEGVGLVNRKPTNYLEGDKRVFNCPEALLNYVGTRDSKGCTVKKVWVEA